MSKALKIERTELLGLCRDFLKKEIQTTVSQSEADKQLADLAWKKVASLVKEDKATARRLAMSQVAEQYLKG